VTTLIDFTESAMAKELSQQATGDPADAVRLSGQLLAVYDLMSDGAWWTLADLAGRVNASTQSVSARIRDLRKECFGAHDVRGEQVKRGLWRYRLVIQHS
jgi:hypothetical protein